MTSSMRGTDGLSLAPFRALRFAAGADISAQICPPYDVISAAQRRALIAGSDTNTVRLILPESAEAELGEGDPYLGAGRLLQLWRADGTLILDATPALYVYEMTAADGSRTRGLLGAVQLRDPADGVILPHENTMAGPVSDRLALMSATEANLEPIYLVYEGGGPASLVVSSVSEQPPVLGPAVTSDGTTHRLWAVTDPAVLADVARDLNARQAMIADGHHRYATYRQLQANHGGEPGPWDWGLTLLVDTTTYGPQVHPIHRVVQLGWEEILRRTAEHAVLSEQMSAAQAMLRLSEATDFSVALARDADHAVVVSKLDPGIIPAVGPTAADRALADLDITLLHRVLVERIWGLIDTEATVGYAHDVADALAAAGESGATAVLLRATPVAAVAAVAAVGGRMPRKSTLFLPKPASGIVIRRFADQ